MTQNNKPLKEIFKNILDRKDKDPYVFFCTALQYRDADAMACFVKKIDIVQHPDTLQRLTVAFDDFSRNNAAFIDVIDRGDYTHDDLLKVLNRVFEKHKETQVFNTYAISFYKRGLDPFRIIEEGSNDATRLDFYKMVEAAALTWLVSAQSTNEITLEERKAIELTLKETSQKKMAAIQTERVFQSPLVNKDDLVDPKHLPSMNQAHMDSLKRNGIFKK